MEERAKVKVKAQTTAEFHALCVYIGFHLLLPPWALMMSPPGRSNQDATDILAITTSGRPGWSSGGVWGGGGGRFSHHKAAPATDPCGPSVTSSA